MHSRFLAGVIDCLTAYRCNGFVLRWDVQSVDGTAATIMVRTTDRTRAHGVGRGGADGEGRHTGAHWSRADHRQTRRARAMISAERSTMGFASVAAGYLQGHAERSQCPSSTGQRTEQDSAFISVPLQGTDVGGYEIKAREIVSQPLG